MHFSLIKASLDDSGAGHALDDLILPLYYAFVRLGFTVEKRTNACNPDAVNIIFCADFGQALQRLDIPGNSILFNIHDLERAAGSPGTEAYFSLLAEYAVWDYSDRNIAVLSRGAGSKAARVRPGYVPEMTRIDPDWPKDIAVLLLRADAGAEAQSLCDRLCEAENAVALRKDSYGLVRDYMLARSGLVVAQYEDLPQGLALPNLGYLLANGCPVVSAPVRDAYPELEQACRFRPEEAMAETVERLVADEKARRSLSKAARHIFSSFSQEEKLRRVVGRRNHASAWPARPSMLNAGCGMDFLDDHLNVDIQPGVNPDLVLDLSQPLDFDAVRETKRFGPITLERGSFDSIIANEILEHVRDLERIMCTFRDLLRIGGTLRYKVPYELSTGGWQDPTHVRVFNEVSVMYFTDNSGYLGWRDERFELVTQRLVFSPYGEELQEDGLPGEDIVRTPRAVEHIEVTLRKRETTFEEKQAYDMAHRAFYKGAAGNWKV